MIDKEAFKRKFALRAFSSPISLVPTVLGVVALLGMLFSGAWSAPVAFLGIVAIVAGLGIAGIRVLTQSEKLAREVMEDMDREEKEADERRLDDLEERLRGDGDERTEGLLNDLRQIMKSYREDQRWTSKYGGTHASIGIISDVEKLEEVCIASLEHTLVIHQRGSMLRNDALKAQYRQSREKVIEEVEAMIIELSESLDSFQGLNAVTDGGLDEARKRAQDGLKEKLRRAELVEARLREFTKSSRQRTYERLAPN